MIVDKFGYPSNYASATLCNLHNNGKLRKKYKLRNTGIRWHWVFEFKG